jgi:protein TonB
MHEHDKKAFYHSIFISVLMHVGVLFVLITHGFIEQRAVPHEFLVTFSEFDPLGGEFGDFASFDDRVNPEIPMDIPPSVPEFEEEFIEEPQIIEEVALIESDNGETMPEIFEKAPVVEEKKPKIKQKPKFKPKPQITKPVQMASNVNIAPSAGESTLGVKSTNTSGFGGGTGKGNKKVMDSYFAKVRNRLDRNKKYPNRENSRNGVVEVSFTILADGQVTGVKIITSSGQDALDDEVMSLVSRVAPFAPIPEEIGKDRLYLIIPVVFSRT